MESEIEKVEEYLFFRIVSIRFRRFSQHCSIPGRITNIDADRIIFSWFFLWRSVSRLMFKRNAKGERTMAHIYFVNISKLSWMIYVSRFVSLFETSRFLSSRFYQALFRERRWIDLQWLIRKKDWRKRKSASVLRCWKELRNSYSEIILASLSKLSKRWSNESN